MDEEKFATISGFESFEEMLDNTFTVIYDHGVCWNATVVHKGWMGWVTVSFEILGYFDTFNQVSVFMSNFFNNHAHRGVIRSE